MKIYGDIYNRRDVLNKVKEYNNKGMGEDEIVKQVNEDAKNAEEIEHEHTPNRGV